MQYKNNQPFKFKKQMKIKKVTVIALMAIFGLVFTACQEGEINPANDQLLKTEGNEGEVNGPEDF